MKTLTALVLLLSALTALAQDRAVLMISIHGKTGIFRKEISEKIRREFTARYRHPLPLVVIQEATQEDLYRETRNPENRAIFWVSHANSFNGGGGLEREDLITDREGHNVKDFFQRVHPNLNLLAVLGCKALPILKKNEYQKNLTLVSFDEKVSSKRAIAKSLSALDAVVFSPGQCHSEEGIPVTITRETTRPSGAVSVKIMNRGRLIGFFPRPTTTGAQTITVHLAAAKSAADLKLVFDSGKIDPNAQVDLGTFTVTSETAGAWSVFSDLQGRPLGVTQHIYRFKGDVPVIVESFEPFQCH